MTPLDDEILMRCVDGELSPDEAARVGAAAALDAGVAARLAALRGTREAAREAFPIGPDARDADLSRIIWSAQTRTTQLAGLAAMLSEAFMPRPAAIWGGLATAAFVGGLALGQLLDGGYEGLTVQSGGGLADAGLVRALDTRLTAEGPDAQGRTVGLTFKDADGRWCRTFNVEEAHIAGLACRRGGRWALEVLAPVPASADLGDLRTAATEAPEIVLTTVDALITGETLDANAETIARNAGWPGPE
jgi:hypothetical protein